MLLFESNTLSTILKYHQLLMARKEFYSFYIFNGVHKIE